MRGVLFALGALGALTTASSAHAHPHLELGGFLGVDQLGSKIALGGAAEAEQRPQTSPTVGARLTVLPLPALGPLALGVEGEASYAPAWTGYGFEAGRPSYYAPVIGARGQLIARLHLFGALSLHAVGGAGAAWVSSSSPYITDTSAARVTFWGVGGSVQLVDGWQLRVDGRQAFLPAMTSGQTATYELAATLAWAFGPHPRALVAPTEHVELATHAPPPPPHHEPEPEIVYDSDGDGIPDAKDACPNEPSTTPGQGDGCPERDPDGDGIIGAADKCPNEPEDFDKFQDDDGCPDPDNDGDGIPDKLDACPNQPETKNGFEDDDGCPDTIPANLDAALAAAGKIKFEPGKARLAPAAKAALDPMLDLLRAHLSMRVAITAHPDADGAAAAELAKKRAEVVKWYLVDEGVASDQMDTAVGAVAKGATLELKLTK